MEDTEDRPTPDELMDESLADWIAYAILEVGDVDDDMDPDELSEVICDFVWPASDEVQVASFKWMMERYQVALLSQASENRLDYYMVGPGGSRRFVGIIE